MIPAFMPIAETSAYAQGTTTGTVTGTVKDPSGALIPGATIVLTDLATKNKFSSITNKDGAYVVQNVPPATYSITATKAGFATDQILSQDISVGTQTTANFALAVGAESTVVEVQASNADLQTINSTIGATVTPLSINSLPSIQRDVSTFATLQPGVTPGGSVAGTNSDQAVFQLDGGNNSSDMDGGMQSYTGSFGGNTTGTGIGAGASGVMPMPQDSIEEFKVATSGQTADFNNASGSQVQVVTKRGTNVIHATAYEYYLDNNFNANTWQNRISVTPPVNATPAQIAQALAGTAKPDYHYSRFGASAGGPIAPYVLGGKTYLFGNYEGFRYPNSATYERSVPSANMRAGMLTLPGSATGTLYNLNTADPRGIGVPAELQKYYALLPQGNDQGCVNISGARCDGFNTIGYKANVALPQKSNFFVLRLDHDFGSKWHFNTSYRYYKLAKYTSNQVDISGLLGGAPGVPTSTENRPQQPWYYVAGLTTNITANTTNDFHFSYLRNYWSYIDDGGGPQLAGLGGALEPLGEYSTTSLTPYNVDTQDVRTRIWDGHDTFFSDNVTTLKGNHLIQYGGSYQHDYAFHNRTDNGGGINYYTTYQLGDSSGGGLLSYPGLIAAGVPATGTTNTRLIDATLGIVSDSQIAYTRSGANLTLNPALTPAFDQSTVPFYNVYVSDTWHARPTVTVNAGVGYAIEMPPVEKSGKQVSLVDAADNTISSTTYLANRASNAALGQIYNPQLGFALVGNTANGGQKYPFHPYFGQISPRVSLAWNPHFAHDTVLAKMFGESATVVRGGYGRVFGRLNGVGLVLTPLLGPGLIQAVQCRTATANNTAVAGSGGTCASAAPTDSTAFRIGADGLTAPLPSATPTLPQPFYPGYNGAATAAPSVLDPNFRPNSVDSFNLTVQRQINRKMLVEVGYIGRIIKHEFQPINLNTVPYQYSAGGQSFENAYAQLETSFGCATSQTLCAAAGANASAKAPIFPTVAAQPFFEAALAGTGYCTGYTNCTTAVVHKLASNIASQQVFSLWSTLDNGAFNFPRSMQNTPIAGQANGGSGQITSGVAPTTALGYGNYNGGFISFKTTDYHGLTTVTNFTYSKALGLNDEAQSSSSLTTDDAFDLRKSYGRQPFDQKFIFNTFLVYQTPWYKEQHGIVGRLLGGYTIAPVITAGTGQPLGCTTNSGAQSFGESDDLNFSANEQCVFTQGYKSGYHSNRGIAGGNDPNYPATIGGAASSLQIGTTTAGKSRQAQVNMFSNPVAIWDTVRAPILGIDEKDSGEGPISNLPYFSFDVSIRKNVKVFERVNLEFSGIMTNVLNHLDFSGGTLNLTLPAQWGEITGQGNAPRAIQMGLRASY